VTAALSAAVDGKQQTHCESSADDSASLFRLRVNMKMNIEYYKTEFEFQ